MINSLLLSFFRPVGVLAMAGLILAAAGCADSITRSRDTRNQGIAAYNAGDHSESAGVFRQAIRQDPRDYRSHYYLGRTYDAMGLPQQAIQSYKSSLDVMRLSHEGRGDTDFRVRTMEALAVAIARSDDRHLELDTLERQARGGTSSEAHYLLAKIYRNSGDPDSAVDSYNRAVILDGRNFHLLKEYGLYLEQLGQNERAEPMFRKAYAVNPNDPEVEAALRRNDIVPGLSLRNQDDLMGPGMPKGPIEVRGFNTPNRTGQPVLPPREEEQTVQIPRD